MVKGEVRWELGSNQQSRSTIDLVAEVRYKSKVSLGLGWSK